MPRVIPMLKEDSRRIEIQALMALAALDDGKFDAGVGSVLAIQACAVAAMTPTSLPLPVSRMRRVLSDLADGQPSGVWDTSSIDMDTFRGDACLISRTLAYGDRDTVKKAISQVETVFNNALNCKRKK